MCRVARRRMHTTFIRQLGWFLVLVAIMLNAGDAAAAGPHQTMELRSEEVIITNAAIRLAGTLIIPSTPPPYPVVVIVHGASPSQRLPFRSYASTVFVQHGVAALIYDKRGAGQSSGDLERASLDDLASDVRAVVQYLKGRNDIKRDAIGLVGDSQAGWVIPLAAASNGDVAFLAMISPSAVSPAQQEDYSITRKITDAGLGLRLTDTGLKGRKLLEDYARQVRRGRLPALPTFRNSSFVNLNLDHDPVPTLQQLTYQPVLIILGGADAYVPASHTAAVMARVLQTAGNRDYTIRIYQDADHGIQVAGVGGENAVRRYAPGYREGLTAWVVARARGENGTTPVVDPGGQEDAIAFGPSGIYGPLPWYGRAALQLSLVLLGILGFGTTLSVPAGQTLRKRRAVVFTPGERVVRLAVLLTSLLHLLALLGLISLVGLLLEGARPLTLSPMVYGLPPLAVLAVGSSIVLWGLLIRWWSHRGRAGLRWVRYSFVAVLAVVFVPFYAYWNLLGFGW